MLVKIFDIHYIFFILFMIKKIIINVYNQNIYNNIYSNKNKQTKI